MIINLDCNATFGLLEEVEEQLQYLISDRELLNPSSIHRGGQRSKLLIEDARNSIRELINASEDTAIIFTSGATEANNTVVNWILRQCEAGSSEVVVSAIEHPSLLRPMERLTEEGVKVNYVYPEPNGVVSSDKLLSACSKYTVAVSVMAVNNETGVVQPIEEIATLVKKVFPDVVIHCDASQSLGKCDLNFSASSLDALSISGHKIGALMGVGALVLKPHLLERYYALMVGGAQEHHLRGGTENLIGIATLGCAADIWQKRGVEMRRKMQEMRDSLKDSLLCNVDDIVITGEDVETVCNTLHLRIKGVYAPDLVVACDLKGLMISSGSACASGKTTPSYVLENMGFSKQEAAECVRLSINDRLTDAEIEQSVNILSQAVLQLRQGEDRTYEHRV